MSGAGGVSIARSRGESRFYNPPQVRRQLQLLQQQQQQQKKKQEQRGGEKGVSLKSSVERRTDPDECATSSPSLSNGNVGNNSSSTNLDRFLEFTTPVVPAQYLPKTSMKGWRSHEREPEFQPYFLLGDLWESFKEWSAYGVGVPLLLNGGDSVMQYYCPYLSGMQLYIDPSRSTPRLRRPGEESDTESSRETSSDDSSDYGVGRQANNVVQGAWSQHNSADVNIHRLDIQSLKSRQFASSSSDESEICNPSDQLIFEYLEHALPFTREPLADKISFLASRFPELRTYRSCELSHSSWISVAWYPIYRIPTGPTLQNLDACFLTFHSLSTPSHDTKADRLPIHGCSVKEFRGAEMSLKLPLPTFGLAFYKFKPSVWNPDGVHKCQQANSLLQKADNWLRLLRVNHPDYTFFVSNNSRWR
ncbi:hypothetical protein SLEP1_g40096 [Rubroshorea leprosula]|uniref:Uncharacterized protein n=1 Tax=Rubroshorea leprosula TaxID=152421 RepID=A0AAV5L2D4_9ROSI|nr:hypothetical protein SLEP1_g40096 [Rubroshorea leprosula]